MNTLFELWIIPYIINEFGKQCCNQAIIRIMSDYEVVIQDESIDYFIHDISDRLFSNIHLHITNYIT